MVIYMKSLKSCVFIHNSNSNSLFSNHLKCVCGVSTNKFTTELLLLLVILLETGSHYVAQVSLKLMILLPQPLECWVTSMYHHAWLYSIIYSNAVNKTKGSAIKEWLNKAHYICVMKYHGAIKNITDRYLMNQ
jgi:hypothetical protein